jgi:hypothetical protein
MAEKVWSGPLPSLASTLLATQLIEEESRPPLSIEPTGKALRNRQRTDSVNISRNASEYSSFDRSLSSFERSGDQYC